MDKMTKYSKRILAFTLAAGMVATSVPVYADSTEESAGTNQSKALALPETKEITKIDFTSMKDLKSLPANWKISNGSGTSELVDDANNEKALKLQKNSSGNEISLVNDNLGINESEYRYVTIETKIKMGTDSHANQFSIPYLQDKSGATAYTLYADGEWASYKSHVNGKNVLEAGDVKQGEWQDVRMDIDLKEDTFRVSVDGEYELVGVNARQKTDNLKVLKYYADSWNTGTIYIKSVEVTAQKERTESTTFYVSNNGDDSNDGQSAESTWKTLDKVNSEHFIAGDKILFERGGVWENQTLQPQGSGDEEQKITIGSYGEGELPEIAANGKMKDAMYLCNQQYWEISELDVSNTVEGFGMTSNGEIPTGNVSTRNEADGKLLGEYRGIHIAGRDVATLKGFHVHNIKVHDVTGVVSWIGDTGLRDAGIMNNAGLDKSKRTGGILIECLSPTGNQATQFSDITIEDSTFINNSFGAISIKQWNGSGNQYGKNPGWANRGQAGGAPDYTDNNWKPHSNITIQNNYINQGASAYACNGIYLTSSRDSLIQGNLLEHIGTCGIELYFTDNVAVQYNEISDVVKKGGGADDNAIDPDWRATNALIQYNYIHDCGEGLLLCGVQYNSGVIRYNLVQDCGRSYVHYSMGSGYFQIYNNVFYRSADGNGTSNFDPWGGGKVSYVNNVFYDGKKTGFSFSGGSSFSYYNNAYYGTSAPGKDSNPLILTEDPFEGTAPSMDRKGTLETGVLLEANGLKPKANSELINTGATKDANGISIEDGLSTKGSYFNFTPLAKVFGDSVKIARTDYPTFTKTDSEATLDTEYSQTLADKETPTIGMFEANIDENAVILRGTVSDGINPLAGATVKVEVNGKVVETTTNDSGVYSIMEGLSEGEATITVISSTQGEIKETIKLEKGKINKGDVKVPLVPMPNEYENVLFEENYDNGTSGNFFFDKGAKISDGKLVLTTGMGNATAGVSYFSSEIAAQKGVDFSFDWNAKDGGNKMGLEFRDTYGRLVFAVCAAPSKNELRTSTTGDSVDDSKAASASEPTWSAVTMSTSKTYTIRVHADFEAKTVSWQLKEKDGDVLAQELNVTTDATNLAKMNICSWWDSRAQYIDNFRMTGKDANVELALKDKSIYAFGDSIVAGHQYTKSSFADFAAAKEGMKIQKFAVNGATVMDCNYDGGQILSQIENASAETPDYVLLDGGTNDAEYILNHADTFDYASFEEALETTISKIQEKWNGTQVVYVAVHKLGSRDIAVQEKLREIEFKVCEKYQVAVADVYEKLDTSDVNKKNDYTFDGLGSNGLPANNGSGTHPNFKAIEEFYVPTVSEVLENPKNFIPSTTPVVDKTELETKLAEAKAEAEKTDVYSAESLEKLNAAIKSAEEILADENATQEQVEAQLQALKSAVSNLVKKETADKSSLTAMIEAVENLKEEDFSTASWAVLKEKLETAKAVLANESATQEEVDTAYAELVDAYASLEAGINKVVALQMKAEAEAVLKDADKYQSQGLAKVQDALDALNAGLENAEITQTELDNLSLSLLDALMNIRDVVDGSRLQAVIDIAQKLLDNKEKFTSTTADELEKAVEAAKKVLENKDRTEKEIEDAYQAVNKAIAGLKYRGNREILKPFIEKAEEILAEKEKYASGTLEGLAEANETAKTVYENEDALQDEINEAAKTLATELAQVRLLGDVNHDDKVDTADAAILLKVNAELSELPEDDATVADVNKDGVIDTKDAVLIEQYAAEMISKF